MAANQLFSGPGPGRGSVSGWREALGGRWTERSKQQKGEGALGRGEGGGRKRWGEGRALAEGAEWG